LREGGGCRSEGRRWGPERRATTVMEAGDVRAVAHGDRGAAITSNGGLALVVVVAPRVEVIDSNYW
jgi:hypothetical protein